MHEGVSYEDEGAEFQRDARDVAPDLSEKMVNIGLVRSRKQSEAILLLVFLLAIAGGAYIYWQTLRPTPPPVAPPNPALPAHT